MKFSTFEKIVGFLFIGIGMFTVGALYENYKSVNSKTPTKDYTVRVVLCGEGFHSTFDCDSVTNEGTFQYAWKDGVRIPLKNVYEIKFN